MEHGSLPRGGVGLTSQKAEESQTPQEEGVAGGRIVSFKMVRIILIERGKFMQFRQRLYDHQISEGGIILRGG